MDVTVYDSESVTATAAWVASTNTDQAYAHPIDGFKLDDVSRIPPKSGFRAFAGDERSRKSCLLTILNIGILKRVVVGGCDRGDSNRSSCGFIWRRLHLLSLLEEEEGRRYEIP